MAINGNLIGLLKGAGAVLPPAAMLGILGFMGNGIVANDKVNTSQHISIRKEQVIADTRIRDRVDVVKDIVTDIRLEQRTILESLRRIEEK